MGEQAHGNGGSGCIHAWFEAQVARSPEAVAVSYEGRDLTYAELNARANILALDLLSTGVGPESLVGLFVERSLDIVVGILGILKAGGAYLPIDSDNPPGRTQFILDDAQPGIIVTTAALRAGLPQSSARVFCVDQLDYRNRRNVGNPPHSVRAENLAYVIYTSGSTGQPKGTLVTHRNVIRLFQTTDSLFEFSADDVWSVFHSFAFDFSVWELWGALLHGAKAVIVPRTITRIPQAFHALLVDQRITVLSQTPSAFYFLIEADAEANASSALALRYIVFGGETLEFRRLESWFARHGEHPRLVNMYGITETTVHTTHHEISKDALSPASIIGVPLPDLRIHLLDENRRAVPEGALGEIYVGGPGVTRGYLNRPELTEARFIADPFSTEPGARLYRSGDRARRRPDGALEYGGRTDNQVKLRGYRIELGEIEGALSRCGQVRQALVVLRSSHSGEQELVAYLITDSDAAASPSRMREELSATLPAYMVPSAFVRLESFPLTQNGKIDRHALPRPRREHRVALSTIEPRSAAALEPTPPRTATEALLKQIWSRHLGHGDFGVTDDFFDLGGHSLAAAAIFAEMTAKTGVALPLALLFKNRTIAALGAVIDAGGTYVGDSHILDVQPSGTRPPIFALFGIGGGYAAYATVTAGLGRDQPFYSLEMPGLDGGDLILERIEDIAQRFCQEIDKLRPDEPCVLIGACAGALVVFEMAQRLSVGARRVEVVVMLDPPPTGAKRAKHLSGLRIWRRLLLPRFLFARAWMHATASVRLRGPERRRFLREKLSVLREIITQRDLLRDSRHELTMNRVREAASAALERYVPRAYAGRVALLLGDRYAPGHELESASDWKISCTGAVQVHRVPGKDTGQMLKPPNSDVLVTCLKEILGTAREV